MSNIFVVEDDENIRNLILYGLNSKGYSSIGFSNSNEFYKELESTIPDLIILDIMLPGDDGFTILNRLKSNSKYKNIPIIFLTAKTSEYDRIKGLDMGADDYVLKPFSVMELMSRVNAVLRRYNKKPKENEISEDILVFENIKIDNNKRKVLVDNEEIDLTFKEFELLKYLVINKNMVLTRNTLMNEIWGFDFEGESRTIDVHIRSLRQKLKNSSKYIKTVRNVGYKIGV